MDFKRIPKVELHLHLDGSLNIDTVSSILGYTKEEVLAKMVVSKDCQDLNAYLACFDYPVLAMQTKEALKKVSNQLIKDLEEENVVYAEVRFAPFKHTQKGLTLEEVVDSVLEGFTTSKCIVNLILCCMRDDTLENNLKIIELAKEYKEKGVVGVDLAGAEAVYPTKNFASIFKKCREYSIPFTIHAGEASGYDSILSAIEFGTTRIGHGVRAIESEELVSLIKQKNILLEVCPTSNIQTKVYDTYQENPIYDLYKKGIKVCINTDNRTVSNTTLTKEYQFLKEAFAFELEDFYKMNEYAIDSSFATFEQKEKIKNILKKEG